MRRYNDGMIYTNDRCVACNHCVHVCPAVGANVTANDNGRITIDVSDKNCIHCGSCIRKCVHSARQYNDDLDDLIRDLNRKAQVSVIVDPSFVVAYGTDIARKVFGFLKSIGVSQILDGSVGGDISILCHANYIFENMDENGKCDKFLAHTCPGFSNYVSRYAPSTLGCFIPAQLPAVCAAIYYRKYKGIKNRFAFLSPCTAIQDELKSFSSGRNINYLIGISGILEIMKEKDISGYDSPFDIYKESYGSLICENDAFTSIVSGFFPSEYLFKSDRGLGEKFEMLLNSPEFSSKDNHPTMVTLDLCPAGCVEGPAIDRDHIDIHSVVKGYENMHTRVMSENGGGDLTPSEKFRRFSQKYSDLNLADFWWEGEESFRQKCSVPADVVEEIFESMHKTTDVSKHLNCQSCGYTSCYEMATAVANGYSRVEDCVHYLNDELKIQLGMDPLTGLYNNRGFYKAAVKLVSDNPDRRYIMAVGDINGLGGINDLYKNTGGDAVITYVAKAIEEFADGRGECGRISSGVFGCIFEYTDENIERLKEDTQLSISHLGMDYPLTIKFGLYELKDNQVTMPRAVLLATYAYRTTKDKSRNTYVFYTEQMSKDMLEEAEITRKMKKAMENKEFVLYFQPKYDHDSGRAVGAEALSRWIEADGSMISPGRFIPVFEKNGYITELDRYVWKTSFELVTNWLEDHDSAIPVSVNISRISLIDDSIIRYINNLRNTYPDAAAYIQFEITESAYADNVGEIFERVQKIREMGFKVNMDDFGSGYSSLNLLKDAPIDVVKLDMGFLRGEDRMGRGRVIISSVVNMTKELGFELVAEGVETKEQADFLAGMGCKVIQGYFYAKPMPEPEFVKLLGSMGNVG